MTRDGMMLSKRDIVVINFPYSDSIGNKKRPVLILGEKMEDFVVCAITSNPNVKGVPLQFEEIDLPLKSTAKYWQIQTILKSRMEKKLAKITKNCYKNITTKIAELFSD